MEHIVVDGKTNWIARVGPFDEPVQGGATVTVALVAGMSGDGTLAPAIHATVAGVAQQATGQTWARGMMARDLAMRLAPHAGRVVYLRASVGGVALSYCPLRVVWAIGDTTFPVR